MVRTACFDEELAAAIADRFRFDRTLLGFDLALRPGQHVFVDKMPEVDEIARSADSAYDDRHPTLSFYVESGPGVETTVSYGGKQQHIVRVLLRWGTNGAKARRLLCGFYDWAVRSLQGFATENFVVRGVITVQEPVGVYYEGDDHAFASCAFRLLVVAR